MRPHSNAVYNAARACADYYQAYSLATAWLEKTAGLQTPVPLDFDAERAAKLCDDLDAAVEAFIDAAHREINGHGPE